jgi:hypothetical protein
MGPSRFDGHEAEHDHDVQAQLCAYNTAFAELGLRFRWDALTLASLATIDGERARIAAYIEAHHAHLLNAYSAEFLCEAILAKKSAHYQMCRTASGESTASVAGAASVNSASGVNNAARVNSASDLSRGRSWWESASDDSGVPALAGA